MNHSEEFDIRTGTQSELVDITPQVRDVVRKSGVTEGICYLFIPHTTAGLTLNENWDPAVQDDILRALDNLVPRSGSYRHAEGNSAAHIKAMLVGFSATIPIQNAALAPGTWQGVFLAEFDGPRHRRVLVQILST
jgi:secondary thiamine-phosphate synthase enzyme